MMQKILFSLAVCVFITAVSSENEDKSCPWRRTDIVIFVDQKNTTGEAVSEETVKPFLNSFVTILKRQLKKPENQKHHVRVAVVTFGGQFVVQHCLADDQKQESILKSVEDIRYGPGSINIAKAFEKCTKARCFDSGLKESNYKADQTIILMLSDASADEKKSMEAASKIFKDKNFKLFGIGTGFQERETGLLQALSSHPSHEHVFNIRDRCTYDIFVTELLKFVRLDQCSQIAGPVTPPVPTTMPAPILVTTPANVLEQEAKENVTETSVIEGPIIAADIAFIIDSSLSLLPEQFQSEKDFSIDIMGMIPMGEHAARFAALTFASSADVHFRFDSKASLLDVVQAMNEIPFKEEGRTFTDVAIHVARTDLFGTGYTARPDNVKVAKIAIVITDGAPSKKIAMKEEADLARKDGITILAVGIGKNFSKNRATMLPMVGGREELLFIANQFSELNSKIDQIMAQLQKEA